MSDAPEEREFHLNQIERHVQALRGDGPGDDVTPWDFRLPTGRALRDMRKACTMSCEQAADAMGYSKSHVRNIELGNVTPGTGYMRAALAVYRGEWPR